MNSVDPSELQNVASDQSQNCFLQFKPFLDASAVGSKMDFLTMLTLKAPSKICSRQHSKIFILYFSEKTSLDISCESSAWQTIHMKCQDFFSSENKKKIIKIVVCFSCDWRFKG